MGLGVYDYCPFGERAVVRVHAPLCVCLRVDGSESASSEYQHHNSPGSDVCLFSSLLSGGTWVRVITCCGTKTIQIRLHIVRIFAVC